MKKLIRLKKNSFLLFFFFLFFFVLSTVSVLADDVTVTANISDTEDPSTPILISPSDGALISDNTPSFQWYESTDNVLMNYYVFYLNGGVLYNNIPLVDTDNSYYTLDYDSLNGIYTLTPKSAIADGNRNWKVVAVDYAYNTASSDTWDFTLDTQAPSFVLQKIGDTSVSYSASNADSVPDNPITIFQNDATANEPILLAIGEANSSVQLTVTIPDDPTQSFTTSINGDGDYEQQLGILPRDTIIELDFIITDQVGHVSVLENVYFKIALQYWPTTTTTPTPTTTVTPSTSITATPTVAPSGEVGPTLTPSVSPTGIVPIIPPKEIIHEIGDEVVELLPESAEGIVRTFLKSKTWLNLSLFIPFLLLLLFYFVSFMLFLSKFIQNVSWALLKKAFILLWPFLDQKKRNLVFEYSETIAAPLVKVDLLNNQKKVIDFAITDINGNFADLDYPSDSWFLAVSDQNFYYPIGETRPSQLSFLSFYQGQELSNKNYQNEPILIPTLKATGQDRFPFIERVRLFLLYLLDYPLWFWIVSFVFALLFTLRYRSMFNSFSLIFYLLVGMIKLYKFIVEKKFLTFAIKTSDNANFSANLVVSLFEKSSSKAISKVIPFEFSKSKKISHDFESAEIVAFAKNLMLANPNSETNNSLVSFNKKDEEILLQINKK